MSNLQDAEKLSLDSQDAQKGDFLTRPTLARRDAPFPKRGRSERLKMIPPSSLVIFFQGVAWLGPQLRTSNDHCFIVGVP